MGSLVGFKEFDFLIILLRVYGYRVFSALFAYVRVIDVGGCD